MGWIPDLPDPRDYTYRHPEVMSLLECLKRSQRRSLPDEVDLRSDDEGQYFTDAEDQGPLNSSTAFAVLSVIEYFERRINGRTFDSSKLFLYKVTRNLRQQRPLDHHGSHSIGDTGADLRTTFKEITSIGVPSGKICPYDIDKFDVEPSPFLYKLAKPLSKLRYFRLDEPTADDSKLWEVVTSFLAAGFPIAFGFPVPTSLTTDPNIPYRGDLDSYHGGQAAVAVGYKKNHFGRGQHALLIRISWGSQWGDNGNGWLPAAFLRKRLAKDFWTLAGELPLRNDELTAPLIVDMPTNAS